MYKRQKNGRVSFLYGGDFNNYDATDNSFNCNGIIAPDRTWHPHAYEVTRQYQNIWTELLDPAQGRVEVYNENFCVGLDAVSYTHRDRRGEVRGAPCGGQQRGAGRPRRGVCTP